MAARTRAQVETVAKVLAAFPSHRVEVGSRLGPGRPMVTDAVLRSERARIIRNEMIALGIAPERLMLEQGDTYERVVDDVTRAGAPHVQSIGLCVR